MASFLCALNVSSINGNKHAEALSGNNTFVKWGHARPSSKLATLTALLPLCGVSWWSHLGPLPGFFTGRERTGGSEAHAH